MGTIRTLTTTVFLTLAVSIEAAAADAYTFLESVAFSRLPMGACELLNAENARNILLTHRAVLSSQFCGTVNFQAAKQLLELGDAPSPNECRALLELLN